MGQGQGLTDALLDLELYFLLVPLVVDEGKEMFSLADGATDLVILGGLSQIAFVQMPVNRSVTAGVGGLEDKFLGLSGKAFRKVENGVMLGIDQFDLAVQVLPAAGFLPEGAGYNRCDSCGSNTPVREEARTTGG